MKTTFELAILLGFNCNLHCDHCITNSGPNRTSELSDSEISILIWQIIKHQTILRGITFTGGEPSLFIDKMEAICNALQSAEVKLPITIVSNGSFLSNSAKIHRLLTLPNISCLAVSIDEFHKNNFANKFELLADFKKLCDARNVKVLVNTVVGSPLAYQFEERLESIGIQTLYAKLNFVGRGKDIKSSLVARRKSLLTETEKCKFADHMMFVPERGFTSCIKNLTWNSMNFDTHIFQKSIDSLLQSDFYNEICNQSGLMLTNETKTDLASYDHFCDLCEDAYKSKKLGKKNCLPSEPLRGLQETISPFSPIGSESRKIFVVHQSVDCNNKVFSQIAKIAKEHDIAEFLLPHSFPIRQLAEFCLKRDFMPYIIMRRRIDSLEFQKISNESEMGFASSCIEICETKLDNRTANSIRVIMQESMVEVVARDYTGELNKKVKTLHEIAIEKSLCQPFLLFYANDSLGGFLSWSLIKIGDAMTGTLSTHWVDPSLAKHERAHLHKRMFERLTNIEPKYLFASIYFKNLKSINLFEKNKYKPYSIKLARLL